ncbi:ABC transporter substrate-binding protein [Cuniculiplasma sp. SKW3]|uniref:ABC transporter substrate-binding protein n=1 Tax=Cuniculiplasma sp. SKW3 TaxID=3400170 RepID=UPI003FD0F7EE
MNDTNRKILALSVVVVVIVAGLIVYDAYQTHPRKGIVIGVNTNNIQGVKLTKIVSLDPAATTTLYALGAYKYLVGGNSYDSYPPNENLPNVSDYPAMSIQQIVNLSPDAVISFTNYSQSQINQLLSLGIDYVFLSSGTNTSFNLIEQQTTLLGELTGTQSNASIINRWINQSLNVFHNISVPQVYSMFYALYPGSHGTWTAGNETFMNQIFEYAHMKNIAANQTGYYEISNEIIVSGNPQVLILDQYFNTSLVNETPYIQTSAYKTHRIYSIFNDNVFQEPTFRCVYGVSWLLYEVYGIKANLPAFPISLQYNPEPKQVQSE